MIRSLIVEDEQIIRNGLQKQIPWQELGIDEVRVAPNAEAGIAICEEYEPDVIVSDIKMPGITGVEMCKRIRERYPNCQIIFISGYSDKEYLKAAIALGAVNYVEKPIDVEELTNTIRQAVERVAQNSRRQNTVLHTLLQPLKGREGEDGRQLLNEELLKDTAFRILMIRRKAVQYSTDAFLEYCKKVIRTTLPEEAEKLHILADYREGNCFAFMLSSQHRLLVEDKSVMIKISRALLAQHREQNDWFVAIGRQVDDPEKILDSYESAGKALGLMSYKGWNQYAFWDEPLSEYKESITLEEQLTFKRLLSDRKISEAEETLLEWRNRLIGEKVEINFQVRNIYYLLNRAVTMVQEELHVTGQKDDGNFLDQAPTIQEMHDYLLTRVKQLSETPSEEGTGSQLINKVTAYIHKNLADKNLSIKLLADEVYLTPTYLSSLFKKETGMTIGEYLTDTRVKRAKELLMDQSLKLYQVADQVGYEDANYFGKIFKKKTGMLPSEYRDSLI